MVWCARVIQGLGERDREEGWRQTGGEGLQVGGRRVWAS